MASVVDTKRKKTVRINGCVAAAQAAKYADVDVITAYPIRPYTEVMDALTEYAEVTKRLVTFEYILLAGVNDRAEEAAALIRLIRAFGHPSLVNLIPYNEVPETPFATSPRRDTTRFIEQLKSAGIRTTLRRTQGTQIDAACGQLALKGFVGPAKSGPLNIAVR